MIWFLKMNKKKILNEENAYEKMIAILLSFVLMFSVSISISANGSNDASMITKLIPLV